MEANEPIPPLVMSGKEIIIDSRQGKHRHMPLHIPFPLNVVSALSKDELLISFPKLHSMS